MDQRKRNASGVESLLSQPQQNGGVLANRVQQTRLGELCPNLADNLNGLGFEGPKVGQAQRIPLLPIDIGGLSLGRTCAVKRRTVNY